MADAGIRPSDAAQRLGIAGSTLRVYSIRFAAVLSEAAGEPGERSTGGGFRVYSERDLALLARGKELLGRGYTYDQALSDLRLAVPQAATRERSRARSVPVSAGSGSGLAQFETVLLRLGQVVESAQKSASGWESLAQERGREVSELRSRLGLLESRVRALEEQSEGSIAHSERETPRGGGLGRLIGR